MPAAADPQKVKELAADAEVQCLKALEPVAIDPEKARNTPPPK
tara:strand:+ start:392 stop:520 length:129 start_codon:yes stop_codon:yes gene_type:complete